jgi:hypothetical protein
VSRKYTKHEMDMLSRGRSRLVPHTREEIDLRRAKLLTKKEADALNDEYAAFVWGEEPYPGTMDDREATLRYVACRATLIDKVKARIRTSAEAWHP